VEREQLEHVLRACAAITLCRDFVIVGSQAVLGEHPNAPASLKVSREVDIYPLDLPQLADLIDGSIGEGSPFEDMYGYYAQGVGPETAVLPAGWQQRVVRVESPATGGAVGWCIDTHDLAISKYVANREKDRLFLAELRAAGLVQEGTLLARAGRLSDAALVTRVTTSIRRDFGGRTSDG
jgi:hypothetical protein